MMKKCEVSIILAYFALVYIAASVYYMIITRSFGTPFYDAVKKYPELVEIKKKSAAKRGKTFYCGVFLAIIAAWYFKPFKGCD